MANMEDDVLESRNNNFAIKIKKQRYQEHGIDLSITRNGYQWYTVNLLPDEAREVIKELNKYLAKMDE